MQKLDVYEEYSVLSESQKLRYENLLYEKWLPFFEEDKVCYVVSGESGSIESEIVKHYVTETYQKVIGDNHTPKLMYEEFLRYEPISTYFVCFLPSEKKITGVVRAITSKDMVLPVKTFEQITKNDTCQKHFFENHQIPLTIENIYRFHNLQKNSIVSEYSNLAISYDIMKDPEYREITKETFCKLMASVVKHGKKEGTSVYVAQTHNVLFRTLRSIGLETQNICDLPSYYPFEGDKLKSKSFFVNIASTEKQFREQGRTNAKTEIAYHALASNHIIV